MKYAAMTIAGSDPSGGAGIQADLKTFASLGVYGAAVITALTAQNTTGVFGSVFLEPDFVRLQITTVLEDIPVRCVKTGMLGNTGIIQAICDALPNDIMLVCDPVMYAKSGHPLLQKDAMDALKTQLFPRATILTPNYPELAELLGKEFVDADPEENGRKLLRQYPSLQAVLVKGGHRGAQNGMVEDILLWREKTTIVREILVHPYLSTPNTHGTGCTLASAIAAFLVKGEDIPQAVRKAVDYVIFLIKETAYETYGGGHGALPHHRFCRKEEV